MKMRSLTHSLILNFSLTHLETIKIFFACFLILWKSIACQMEMVFSLLFIFKKGDILFKSLNPEQDLTAIDKIEIFLYTLAFNY